MLEYARLGGAIVTVHVFIKSHWNLRGISHQADLSRLLFAKGFRQVVGETPMQYRARWRIILACDRLEHEGASVSPLVNKTESASSAGFKRVVSRAPRDYGPRGETL